jgi:hypothetical protein
LDVFLDSGLYRYRIDHGLKRYFLRKHRKQVDRFYRFLDRSRLRVTPQ